MGYETYVDMANQKEALALVDVVVSMLPLVVGMEVVAMESSLVLEGKVSVAFEQLQVEVVVDTWAVVEVAGMNFVVADVPKKNSINSFRYLKF